MMLALIIAVIVSLEADFVQTKSSAMMSEPQVSTGHLVYRAPDYMQWAYKTPQALVWEMDGEQSNVNPQVQKLLRMIMSSISGGGTDDPKLLKESKKLFREINITMDEQNEAARRVELIEKNGDRTVIEFSHVTKK